MTEPYIISYALSTLFVFKIYIFDFYMDFTVLVFTVLNASYEIRSCLLLNDFMFSCFFHIFLNNFFVPWVDVNSRPSQIACKVMTMHITCTQTMCMVLICFYRSRFCSPAINQIPLSQSKGWFPFILLCRW